MAEFMFQMIVYEETFDFYLALSRMSILRRAMDVILRQSKAPIEIFMRFIMEFRVKVIVCDETMAFV